MSVTLKTSLGDLKIELHCNKVTRSCKNFLALCASGKYDGTIFHRNIKNFIVQGGDTEGRNGKGGQAAIFSSSTSTSDCTTSAALGSESAGETTTQPSLLDHEIKPDLRHDRRGVVAFTDTGKTKKIGSQFYITYKRLPNLDGQYTVIGRIIDGFETLEKMEEAPVDEKKSKPTTDIVIEKAIIHANPIAEEEL